MNQEDSQKDKDLTGLTETQEVSYAEIYANVLLNDEMVITIPAISVETVKTGIKNFKNREAARSKADGLVVDDIRLAFQVNASKEHLGAVDLHVAISRQATVQVLGMRLPDHEI